MFLRFSLKTFLLVFIFDSEKVVQNNYAVFFFFLELVGNLKS